jgi:hypothetical protein
LMKLSQILMKRCWILIKYCLNLIMIQPFNNLYTYGC